MTYGWAIMVVIIAIGALSYYGVLSPDKFLPNTCTLPAGIACLDHVAYASISEIDVTLKNGLGYDLNSVSVKASGCTTPDNQASLKNGNQFTFAPSGCTLASGKKYSGQLNVTFTNTETGVTHTFRGTITTKVSN